MLCVVWVGGVVGDVIFWFWGRYIFCFELVFWVVGLLLICCFLVICCWRGWVFGCVWGFGLLVIWLVGCVFV